MACAHADKDLMDSPGAKAVADYQANILAVCRAT